MKKIDKEYAEWFDNAMELLVAAKGAFDEGDKQRALEFLALVTGGCKQLKTCLRGDAL